MSHPTAKPVVLASQRMIEGGWMHGPMLPDEIFAELYQRIEISYLDALSEESLLRQVGEAAVFIRGDEIPVTRDAIAAGVKLKGIVQVGIGLERVDIEAASEFNIVVANTPFHVNSVAEGAVLLMLAVSRKFLRMIEAGTRRDALGPDCLGTELYRKNVGIVGLGRIGSRIARTASAMGMHILTLAGHGDPATIRDLRARTLSLAELLKHSDFLVLSCPLTPDTEGLIGEAAIGLMKPTAFLVNVSRGRITDEGALYRALREHRIRGAGIDVFAEEPVASTNPLLRLDNVVATPHCVGGTREGLDGVLRGVRRAVERILDGQLPEFAVNAARLKRDRGC